jgi:very-short-patch-repair endonuclease
MNRQGIVYGPANPEKLHLSRLLRREMTEAEAVLWSHLRGSKLNGLKFRRQQVVDGFIADFYCHSAGLIIECDGSVHQSQRAYDEDRDAILRARGLQILRFENEVVLNHLQRVLDTITEVASNTLAATE